MNSKVKGARSEREVAKLLGEWWKQVEPNTEFVRTPLSGGWGGPSLRAEFLASGDLMTTAKKWPFDVEVKNRETWDLDNFIKGKCAPAWSWWRQCQVAALSTHRVPMLWIKRNLKPWIVCLPVDYRIDALRSIVLHRFSSESILHLNYGSIVPSVYKASDVLAVAPSVFL